MVHSEHRPPPQAILVVPVLVALVLTLFAWPQARLEPRGVPVGIAGPPEAAASIEEPLANEGGAFEIHRYADESAARQAILDREIYGAFVASPGGSTLLIASAGSPAVAQALEELAAGLAAGADAAGQPVPPPEVVDVVPTDPDDPRGAAFNSSVLPLLIAGLVAGVLVALAIPPGLGQIAGLVVAATLAGLAAVAIAQGWLEILEGGWLANAAVLSLMVLAIAAVVAGLTGALGAAGIALAAVLVVLIGNPWSGLSTAPELLPTPAGDIGQLLPPGAGGQALRDTAFFDGGALGEHLAVLIAWAAIGLALVMVASRRREGESGGEG
jgi:hypothetical protein